MDVFNREKFLQNLVHLGVSPDDCSRILDVYFQSRIVIAFANGKPFLETIRENQDLQAALCKEELPITENQAETYANLCEAIIPDLDFFHFVDQLTPGLIADEDAFKKCTAGMKDSYRIKLVRIALKLGPSNDATVPDYSQWNPILSRICNNFPEVWYSVHFFPLAFPSPAAKGKLFTETLHFYESNYLPASQLLTDYAGMLLAKSETERKSVVYGALGDSSPLEHGTSQLDTELYSLLTKMTKSRKCILPHLLIENLFFENKGRKDCMIEQSLVGPVFASMLHETDSVCILNPSPFFVDFWSDIAINTPTCMKLADQTVVDLYQHEFFHMNFLPFGSPAEQKYNTILILCRDTDPYLLAQELKANAAPGARVLALIPEVCITAHNGDFLIPELTYTRILSLPSELSETSPRKKVLLWGTLSDTPADTNSTIQLMNSVADLENAVLQPAKSCLTLPRDLLGTGHTLVQIRRLLTSKLDRKSLKAASVFLISREIALHFTTKLKNGYYVGKLCYREKLPDNASRLMGNRLTPYIESGLRTKDPDAMDELLEQVFLANTQRIWDIAAHDTSEFYHGDLSTVTLKTIWICVHGLLLKQSDYMDDLCLKLFCGESQALADLIPGTASEVDYNLALQEVLGMESVIPFWRQLNRIFKTACKAGFLPAELSSENSLPRISTRNRIQEVRDALVKKYFSISEMKHLLIYITGSQTTFDSADAMCIETSLYLAPLIRLFTGLSIRETCALTWESFVYEPTVDLHQLVITHSLSDDNRLIHVMDQNPNKLRCIPLVPFLAQLLERRRDYLCTQKHCDPIVLSDQPIVLSEEHNRANKRFCSPTLVSKICRDAKEAALQDLSPLIISLPDSNGIKELDITSYYGDIYVSSFRYYLRQISELTPGEVAYLLGIKAPDTYSNHYADFSHCLYQKILQLKIQRWVSTLLFPDNSALIPVSGAQTEYELLPCAAGCVSSDVNIENSESETLKSIKLQISSPYGFSGTVICN